MNLLLLKYVLIGDNDILRVNENENPSVLEAAGFKDDKIIYLIRQV